MEIQEGEQAWAKAEEFEVLLRLPGGGTSQTAGWQSRHTQKTGDRMEVLKSPLPHLWFPPICRV